MNGSCQIGYSESALPQLAFAGRKLSTWGVMSTGSWGTERANRQGICTDSVPGQGLSRAIQGLSLVQPLLVVC